jgi:hypothetical protein
MVTGVGVAEESTKKVEGDAVPRRTQRHVTEADRESAPGAETRRNLPVVTAQEKTRVEENLRGNGSNLQGHAGVVKGTHVRDLALVEDLTMKLASVVAPTEREQTRSPCVVKTSCF